MHLYSWCNRCTRNSIIMTVMMMMMMMMMMKTAADHFCSNTSCHILANAEHHNVLSIQRPLDHRGRYMLFTCALNFTPFTAFIAVAPVQSHLHVLNAIETPPVTCKQTRRCQYELLRYNTGSVDWFSLCQGSLAASWTRATTVWIAM